jgi:imidazolonepropionase-like amidohydrolase
VRTIVRNGVVLDTNTMIYDDASAIVIEDGVIVDVTSGASGSADLDVDVGGQFVVPGLIDAHVHFRLASLDFASVSRWSEVEYGIAMAGLARATVERGFTTVRDLGGDVVGLLRAIRRGAAMGPRVVRAGRMLSQTGGHGDARSGELAVPQCACAMPNDVMSIIADGADAVRKAARHNLADGSDFLKIHVSGGVASPKDPLHSVQYTPAEIEAAVTEARHRGTYVAAHAYTPEAIAMAVANGVHTIEHANLIDHSTAAAVAAAGAVIVPTLSTYEAMHELGATLGMPAKNLKKNEVVYEAGLKALQTAVEAGVTLGLGTDLIGETQIRQTRELLIRAEVQPAVDVLRAMWGVNPTLCHLDGRIGVVAPGAFGDLVVSTIDPLTDMVGFADYQRAHSLVIQGGELVVDRR